MIDPLEVRLCPDRPHVHGAWANVYQHHKAGGLMSRVFFREWQLEINAQFTRCKETTLSIAGRSYAKQPGDDPYMVYVLGGGRRMTPTAFGEELDRQLKALTIPQPEESHHA